MSVCASAQVAATWVDNDIGTVGVQGSSSLSTGTFTINGAGSGIGGTADSCHLVSEAVNGNIEIIAHVGSIQNTSASATSGVMMRESTASGAISAYMAVTAGNGVSFIRRTTTGGSSTTTTTASTQRAPVWLRLTRNTYGSGQFVLTGYYSTDGASWTSVGTATFAMANNVLMGMAVSSDTTSTTAASSVDHVDPMINVPQASSNLVAWYRADVGVTQSGNSVSAWADQSGNNNNASQATYSKQPALEAATLNGQPVLHFTHASATVMSVANSSGLEVSQITAFVISRNTGTSGGSLISKAGSTVNYTLAYATNIVPRFYINSSVEYASGSLTSGTWGMLESEYDQSNISLYVNGTVTQKAYTPAITASVATLYLGGQAASNTADGDIAEILIFNSALSATQRQQVEGYLYTKYGVGVNPLPVITSASTATGNVSSPFSYAITASASPTSFGTNPSPPAPGLSLSASTGTISGTPTTAGTSTVTISATNAVGTGSALLALTISGPTTCAAPTFSPGTGTYTSAQTVTIASSTPGATIYYTTNGSTPTTSSPSISSGGTISVSSTETVEAIAAEIGYSNSSVSSATYTIGAVAPSFSPGTGSYSTPQTVTLSTTTSGATIYYTTNGSTPTTSSSHVSSGGTILVSATETVNAMAVATGYANSSVSSATYTFVTPAATPTFSPAGGTYTGPQGVTISSTTPGAIIYFTTDGSTPTTSSSHYFNSGLTMTVSVSETVNAIAVATGYANSAVGTASYTITSGVTQYTEVILHNFGTITNDGQFPEAPLFQASDGNFYGTTNEGGIANSGGETGGTIFEITPSGTLTILHAFAFEVTTDGCSPMSPVMEGSDGNLYGTASQGGVNGEGTLYQLSLGGSSYNPLIKSFGPHPNATIPRSNLIEIGVSFFGTLVNNGSGDSGAVFQYNLSTGTLTYPYQFGANTPDGDAPVGTIVGNGAIYGVTETGGGDTGGEGMVYEISGGSETILHTFHSGASDGSFPLGGLLLASDGNLYGTTSAGGTADLGIVFKITLSGGSPTYSILHNFGDGSVPNDGIDPSTSLIEGADHNFYGTTGAGGNKNDGTVFRMTPSGTETIIYSFGSFSGDGIGPAAPLVQGTDGAFYGTTQVGGNNSQGTVFKITP